MIQIVSPLENRKLRSLFLLFRHFQEIKYHIFQDPPGAHVTNFHFNINWENLKKKIQNRENKLHRIDYQIFSCLTVEQMYEAFLPHSGTIKVIYL
jgi:hypothetical protein